MESVYSPQYPRYLPPKVRDIHVHPVANIAADSTYGIASHFTAGAISLSAAYAAMHPLDTLKTNLQANHSFQTFRSSVFSASSMRLLLRGFAVSAGGAAPQGGIRFSTYEFTKYKLHRWMYNDTKQNHNPFWLTAFSAMTGDIASSVVKIPREVITQRLQTSISRSPSLQAQPINAWSIARSIMDMEGIRGFYRGYVSTACRDIPFMVILFSVHENVTDVSNGLCDQFILCRVMAGAVSGGIAGYATTPIDCIKTNIITNTKYTSPHSKTPSIIQTATTLVKEQGWKSLWRGATHRGFWWFCVCGMFFPAYDHTKQLLYNQKRATASVSSSL